MLGTKIGGGMVQNANMLWQFSLRLLNGEYIYVQYKTELQSSVDQFKIQVNFKMIIGSIKLMEMASTIIIAKNK